MTLTTLQSRNEYTATAGQTVFNYTFKIYEDTDLQVYVTAAGTDADDSTDEVTGFSVTGVLSSSGGTVTLVAGASVGDLVTIVSNIPSSRVTDYQSNGDFIPTTVNNDVDRAVSLAKQSEDIINRTFTSQNSQQNSGGLSIPTPESGKYLRWKADLTGVENAVLETSGAVSVGTSVGDLVELIDDGAGVGVWPTATLGSGKGGDIASASPLVVDTDGGYFDVTGTTGFAAMTVAANRIFTLQFDGALVMTHHATNLDLPGEANITTVAGDVATFFATGANTVQCVNYTRADGTAITASAAPQYFVGSATRDLTAATGSVGYTGVGFVPKVIIILGCVGASTGYLSLGMAESGSAEGAVAQINTPEDVNYPQAVVIYTAPTTGDQQQASVSSYDADGFTLSWTKGGSPTGTFTFKYLCIG